MVGDGWLWLLMLNDGWLWLVVVCYGCWYWWAMFGDGRREITSMLGINMMRFLKNPSHADS